MPFARLSRAALTFVSIAVGACSSGTPANPETPDAAATPDSVPGAVDAHLIDARPTPDSAPGTPDARPGPDSPPGAPDAAPAAATLKTVFLILMENHDWSAIKGSTSAPYLNDTLLPMGAHAEQYFNPPNNHPSEPNYIWLEGGQTFGFATDDPPSSTHHITSAAHLARQLENANIPWKSYQEDIAGTVCPLAAVNDYAPKHDPFVFFDDMTASRTATDPYCIAHIRPFTELAGDLSGGSVARYNFLTPNLCDDMHDVCAPTSDSIKQGDTWLAQQIPMIMASAAYQNGGVIIITWDEGSPDDGPIGLIVISPDAKAGYSNSIHYDHSSTLRTVQEIMGVTPLLGGAQSATDLADLFKTFP